MERLLVYIHHSGNWDRNNSFIEYKVEAVVLNLNVDFEEFVSVIGKQIRVDTSLNTLKIRYIVTNGDPQMKIHNDMGVSVYMEMKKRNPDFASYPLCVTVVEKSSDDVYSNAISVGNSMSLNQSTTTVDNHEPIVMIENANVNEDETGLELDETIIITDPENKQVAEKQLYKDKETLRKVMVKFALDEKFQFKVKRSSQRRYDLQCINDECKWYFRSSSLNKTTLFRIREFDNNHTCSIRNRFYMQRQATAAVIGSMVKDKFHDAARIYTAKDIMKDMKTNNGLEITYIKAWREKEHAVALVKGHPKDSYRKLPQYLHMLLEQNPGSVVTYKPNNEWFLYAFVALYASINGWKYCKPLVVVDASFLKTAYRGTIMIACTSDAGGKQPKEVEKGTKVDYNCKGDQGVWLEEQKEEEKPKPRRNPTETFLAIATDRKAYWKIVAIATRKGKTVAIARSILAGGLARSLLIRIVFSLLSINTLVSEHVRRTSSRVESIGVVKTISLFSLTLF